MEEDGLRELGSEDVAQENTPEDSVEPPTDKQPRTYSRFRSFVSFSEADEKRSFLFSHMADCPWPYLLIIPIAFALLIAFGWTTDDRVETDTSRMWIADEGSYARNQRYAKSLGIHESGASFFAAMATSRDGKNILTANRLEEVRSRMEKVENITVRERMAALQQSIYVLCWRDSRTILFLLLGPFQIEYDGVTYNWDDLCGDNPAPYQFPCLRFSAMDLFREARWTFSESERVTYYESAIKNLMIKPLLPRVGIMLEECSDACAFITAYRLDPESVGFPADVANPVGLFGDVGSMGYNHPCRICIEDEYTSKIKELNTTISTEFKALRTSIIASKDLLEEAEAIGKFVGVSTQSINTTEDKDKLGKQLDDIATKLGQLESTITTDDVVDFYFYYVARRMYGELGVESYLKLYAALAGQGYKTCELGAAFFGLTCPQHPSEIDAATAKQHLLNHADNDFSSVATSGVPLPFWSEADGTGFLFQANEETGTLLPVSGSGVNMSAPMSSLKSYMASLFLTRSPADPNSPLWRDMVESNPHYAWFMASLAPVEEGTSTLTLCSPSRG